MLDALDDTPWEHLEHAYGPATDVPDLLRELARDTCDLERVAYRLWGNVFHQGTRWQVTSHVVPFLVEILTGASRDDVSLFLIEYLHHLAIGYPTDVFPGEISPERWFAPIADKEDPGTEPDYGADDINERGLIWERDTYVAIEGSLARIRPFACSSDLSIRLATIALLASFPRGRNESAGVLELAATMDWETRVHVALTQAALELPLVELDVLPIDAPAAIHRMAACARLLASPDTPPPEALATVLAPIAPQEGDSRCVHTETVRALVGRCVARLTGAHRRGAVDALCRAHAGASRLEALTLTESLLQMAFVEPLAAKRPSLDPVQRDALQAIAEHGAFNVGTAIFGNYASILGAYGLPTTRAGILSLLRSAER